MTALIVHAMCAMMPGGGPLPGLSKAEARKFVVRLRRESDSLYFLGLVLGAVVFALTPLFFVGWPLPSFLLPASVLDRHAQRVVATQKYLVKQAVFLVRLNAGMCWGALPECRQALGLSTYPEDPGTFRGQA